MHVNCPTDFFLLARPAQAQEIVTSSGSQGLAPKSAMTTANDATIGRLPVEITSYIFEIYLETENDENPPKDVHRCMTDAPFRLGAVCHLWRTIAWSLPRLWTTLSINIKRNGNHVIAELTKQWLQRSGALPLSICLYQTDNFFWSDIDDDEECSYLSTLMDAIHLESYRWKSFDLHLHFFSIADVYLPTGVATYPSLSVLSASILGSTSAKDFLNRLTLPSLQRVQFIEAAGPVILDSLNSLILRSSCHLTQLCLSMYSDPCPEIFQLLKTTSSLKTLDISFYDNTSLSGFMRYISKMKFNNPEFLPNLEGFQTTLDGKHRYTWEAILDAFLPSSTGPTSLGLSRLHALRSLKLDFRLQEQAMKQLDKYTLRKFSDLVTEGFNISIDFCGEDLIAESLARRKSRARNKLRIQHIKAT